MTASIPVTVAALAGVAAGVAAGVQSRGIWAGRRQLFVRFAGEGETPTLDRRWSTLLEQAVAMNADCRLAMRVPPPTGLR
jgi:hypothetical protein